MRGDFASLSATPRNALPIASNHLCLHSQSVCIMLVFTALTIAVYGFHVASTSPCYWPHYFSYSTTARFKNPLPHLGNRYFTDTRHTHHDHAHCDSHSTAGCLHRTASSYYLVSVHAQCVREKIRTYPVWIQQPIETLDTQTNAAIRLG